MDKKVLAWFIYLHIWHIYLYFSLYTYLQDSSFPVLSHDSKIQANIAYISIF